MSRVAQMEQQAGFALHPLRQWLKKKEILKISLFCFCDTVKCTGYCSHHKANVTEHVLPG